MAKRISLHTEEKSSDATLTSGQAGGQRYGYQVIVAAALFVLFALVLIFVSRERASARREEEAQEELWQAQQHFQEKRYEKALRGDGTALGLLAIHERWGDATRASKLARYYIATIYMRQKRYEEAIVMLERLTIADPIFQSQVGILRGDAHSAMKRYPEAIMAYQEAATYAPNDYTTPRALVKIASLYMAIGELGQARAYYQRICKEYPQYPNYADAQKHLGYLTALLQAQPNND